MNHELKKLRKYRQLKTDAVDRFRIGQTKALGAVNTGQIMLYRDLGKLIVDKQKNYQWEKSVVEQQSECLQKKFKGTRDLSITNLWRISAFYLAYNEDTIISPATGELETVNKNTINQIFTDISWSYNYVIVEKCKDLYENIFYITEAREYGWTKNVLIHQIEKQRFQEKIINQSSFEKSMQPEITENAAITLKDYYSLDFLELSDENSEYQLELSILNNTREFLIEMGGGFTYLGNQYTISFNNKDYKTDLLLFHRSLQALVAIELKVTEYLPEYAGKMNFYLSLLNEKIKKTHENTSIGIIIYKSKDHTTVDFALQDMNKPIGVATYSFSKQLPIELKQFFPTPEELKQRVEAVTSYKLKVKQQ